MWLSVLAVITLIGLQLPAAYGKVERWQTCNFTICYGCYENRAHCYTNNLMRTVPQDMVETLTYLEIRYKAGNNSGGHLYQGDVHRYQSLESLHLFDEFSSLDRFALSTLSNLSWLHLENTYVKFLPENLLAHNPKLVNLQLILNRFTDIPLGIFSENNVQKVRNITFHGHSNVSLLCSNNTLNLPAKFSNFENLKFLDLGYNEFKTNPSCSGIGTTFFNPVSNITALSVEGTDIFQGKEAAFAELKMIEYLDISFLSPYRTCPANSSALFNNITNSVVNLYVEHWEISAELMEECQITSKRVLAGLSSLKLESLNFGYSDGIFGPILAGSIIPPLESLRVLDLSYCRLTSIEKDSLSNYPSLRRLDLTGNPLGPKDIHFVTHALPNLHHLYLRGTNIRSDMFFYYDASNIICSFPNLKTIDFSGNDLRRLPRFNRTVECQNTTYDKMQNIFANDGRIEEFIQLNISGTDNICLKFPYLTLLQMNNNIIRNLYGLESCTHLRHLDVYQNHLYFDHHQTDGLTGVLQQLNDLTWLNLGFNGFRYINSSLLYNMPNLIRFYFDRNDIQSLDERFFSKNPKLQTIVLSNNYLQNLHPALFKELASLELLDLRGNLISVLSMDFLQMLQHYKDLAWFGLGNNPYDCGCDKTYLRDWMKDHQYYTGSGVDFIRCASPSTLRGKRVIDFQNDPFECTIKTALIIGGGVLAGFLVTLVIALPCYKYRWYVKHAKLVWRAFTGSMELVKLEQICPYDAFVSYNPRSEDDCMWVVNELAYAIENSGQSDLKLYLEHRDAVPGTNRYTEREIALEKSKRILIVASNSYLKCADCLSEADLSGLQKHGTEFYQPDRVMVLIRGELSDEIIRPPMSSLLRGKTLQVEDEPRRKEIMWRRIREFLRKPLYTYNRRDGSLMERSNSYNDNEDSTESTPLLHATI